MSAGQARNGAEHGAQLPALQEQKTSQDLNVVSAMLSGQVNCVRVTYG